MATDSPSHGPRRHFHRGRRGHDRRGPDRRGPQQGSLQDQAPRGDHVEVEQIMREIRSRIAQRHGIELTDQQVQELAARRLESILDPRSVKPSLLDQLRRSAGMPPDTAQTAKSAEPPYTFGETTLYESPNGFMRFMRKVLNPILKLFFDPSPLIRALHLQSRFNREASEREAERDVRQAEWNALHFEILRRLVSEVSKVSLEMQSLALRVEALSAKVDFNERRVRGLEGTMHQPRAGSAPRERDRERERERERDRDRESAPQPALAAVADAVPATSEGGEGAAAITGDAPRRRRRRRRGRRGAGGVAAGELASPGVDTAAGETAEGDEFEEVLEPEAAPALAADDHDVTDIPAASSAPERVTPQLQAETPEARETAAPELPPAPPREPGRHEPQ